MKKDIVKASIKLTVYKKVFMVTSKECGTIDIPLSILTKGSSITSKVSHTYKGTPLDIHVSSFQTVQTRDQKASRKES